MSEKRLNGGERRGRRATFLGHCAPKRMSNRPVVSHVVGSHLVRVGKLGINTQVFGGVKSSLYRLPFRSTCCFDQLVKVVQSGNTCLPSLAREGRWIVDPAVLLDATCIEQDGCRSHDGVNVHGGSFDHDAPFGCPPIPDG